MNETLSSSSSQEQVPDNRGWSDLLEQEINQYHTDHKNQEGEVEKSVESMRNDALNYLKSQTVATDENGMRTEDYLKSEQGQKELALKAELDDFTRKVDHGVEAGVITPERAQELLNRQLGKIDGAIDKLRQEYTTAQTESITNDILDRLDSQKVGTPEEQARYEEWLKSVDEENQANLEKRKEDQAPEPQLTPNPEPQTTPESEPESTSQPNQQPDHFEDTPLPTFQGVPETKPSYGDWDPDYFANVGVDSILRWNLPEEYFEDEYDVKEEARPIETQPDVNSSANQNDDINSASTEARPTINIKITPLKQNTEVNEGAANHEKNANKEQEIEDTKARANEEAKAKEALESDRTKTDQLEELEKQKADLDKQIEAKTREEIESRERDLKDIDEKIAEFENNKNLKEKLKDLERRREIARLFEQTRNKTPEIHSEQKDTNQETNPEEEQRKEEERSAYLAMLKETTKEIDINDEFFKIFSDTEPLNSSSSDYYENFWNSLDDRKKNLIFSLARKNEKYGLPYGQAFITWLKNNNLLEQPAS